MVCYDLEGVLLLFVKGIFLYCLLNKGMTLTCLICFLELCFINHFHNIASLCTLVRGNQVISFFSFVQQQLSVFSCLCFPVSRRPHLQGRDGLCNAGLVFLIFSGPSY